MFDSDYKSGMLQLSPFFRDAGFSIEVETFF